MNKQTFAQYLINKNLPSDIRVTSPVDGKELKRVLTEVHNKHPHNYGRVVMDLKRLGDLFSTSEGMTMGMAEIAVPNKANRDALVKKFKTLHDKPGTSVEQQGIYQAQLQDAIIKNDTAGGTDDATMMVDSGALGGKRVQLVKLRSTPVVVADHKGDIVPEIFTKSYSEGMPVLHHWLQAAESRRNLVAGQLSTSAPGEMNKVISNLMNESVVSTNDCGTKQGISLFAKDDDVLDRYLAAPAGRFKRGTLITSEVQQAMMGAGADRILVRSPQTCAAKDNSVCSMCMGLGIGSGKPIPVGTNAGMLASESISEPLVQLTLSAKHSSTMAGGHVGLLGEKGFRAFTTMPKEYPDRKVLAELYGVIESITPAPQGGQNIVIRRTQPVPDRYLVNAKAVSGSKTQVKYYIPPMRRLLPEVKVQAEVFPGMELTDGNDNLQDIARLKNLGAARSAAAEGMRNIFKNTGQTVDRRHFELLSRNMMNFVKIEKAPRWLPFRRGEVVEYNAFQNAMDGHASTAVPVNDAAGHTLAASVNQFTAGTMVTPQLVAQMHTDGIRQVQVNDDVEISPVATPMTRTLNSRVRQWIGNLNHRFLRRTITDAATQGQPADIHGFNPIASYAYGSEMRQDEQGRY